METNMAAVPNEHHLVQGALLVKCWDPSILLKYLLHPNLYFVFDLVLNFQ